MRLKIAIALAILGLLVLGAGIGQRTVWLPPATLTASAPAAVAPAPLTVISPDLLKTHDGQFSMTVKSAGPIQLAVARERDIIGWIGKAAYTRVGAANEEFTALSSESVKGEETVPNPTGSDMWVTEEKATGELTYKWQAPGHGDWALLLSSDGTAPAPTNISVTVDNDASTPWAVPLMIIGSALLALAALLFILGSRKPQAALVQGRRAAGRVPADPATGALEVAKIVAARENANAASATAATIAEANKRSRRAARPAGPDAGTGSGDSAAGAPAGGRRQVADATGALPLSLRDPHAAAASSKPVDQAGTPADGTAAEEAGAANSTDAGKPDAGNIDARKPDAGNIDAGKPDAGKPDAGKPDERKEATKDSDSRGDGPRPGPGGTSATGASGGSDSGAPKPKPNGTPLGTPDAPAAGNKTPDNKTPDNKTPDNKTPGNKTPDNSGKGGKSPAKQSKARPAQGGRPPAKQSKGGPNKGGPNQDGPGRGNDGGKAMSVKARWGAALAAVLLAGSISPAIAEDATTPAPETPAPASAPASAPATATAATAGFPNLLDSQVQRIATSVATVVATGDNAKNATELEPRVAGMALQVRTANYAIRAQLESQPAAEPVNATKLLAKVVSTTETWPRAAMLVTQGENNSLPQLLTLVQAGPRENYKLIKATPLLPGQTFPKVDKEGTKAVDLKSSDGLKMSPEAAISALSDRLTNAESKFKDTFKDSIYITSVLDLQKKVVADAKDADYVFSHKGDLDSVVSLRTADGGAMVVVGNTFGIDATSKESATLTVGDDAAVFTGGKETTRGFNLSYAEPVVIYIPPAGGSDQLTILSANRSLVAGSFKE